MEFEWDPKKAAFNLKKQLEDVFFSLGNKNFVILIFHL